MTRFYLIRHGAVAGLGTALSGRSDVTLTAEGLAEAGAVARRLAVVGLRSVHASPLPRTRATAEAVAAEAGVPLLEDPAFLEVDFGQWTGQRFDALESDPRWRAWNRQRSAARAPGGESMLEAQGRAVAGLLRLCDEHPDAPLAVVSHADIVRALLTWALGMPLDHLLRLDVAPASVSIVEAGAEGVRVLCVNHTGERLPG